MRLNGFEFVCFGLEFYVVSHLYVRQPWLVRAFRSLKPESQTRSSQRFMRRAFTKESTVNQLKTTVNTANVQKRCPVAAWFA